MSELSTDVKQMGENLKETLTLVRELRGHFEDDLVNLLESMHSDDQCSGSLRQYAFDRISKFDIEYKRKLAEKIKENMKASSLWHEDDIEQCQSWFEEVFE